MKRTLEWQELGSIYAFRNCERILTKEKKEVLIHIEIPIHIWNSSSKFFIRSTDFLLFVCLFVSRVGWGYRGLPWFPTPLCLTDVRVDMVGTNHDKVLTQ